MTITITVLYPNEEGKKFDLDYYLKTHMPLVEKTWKNKGLLDWQVVQIGPQADGSKSPYQVQALLTFESGEAFKAAADSDGATIFGDIPNFTDTTALLLVGANIAALKK